MTGCSSGLGKALTEELLRAGERVVATLRKPSQIAHLSDAYPSSQLLVRPLDVTDEAQIQEVFTATREHFGRLDVVVNNAGYGIQGEFETFPEEVGRHLVEVLLWGPARICREVRHSCGIRERSRGDYPTCRLSNSCATSTLPARAAAS